jgi:hypothetical protein
MSAHAGHVLAKCDFLSQSVPAPSGAALGTKAASRIERRDLRAVRRTPVFNRKLGAASFAKKIDRVGAPDHDLRIRGNARSILGLRASAPRRPKNFTVGGVW